MRLLAALCLLAACAIRHALATVKCYCTDDHCVPYGACDGAVCLVGILRENNQVIRTCGSRPLGCHRDEDDRWTDLCACDQPFCNTFSYLRSHTSQRRETHPPDDVPLVFERVDRPDDGFPPEQGPVTVSSLLTVLLVVVPLTVGAATVLKQFGSRCSRMQKCYFVAHTNQQSIPCREFNVNRRGLAARCPMKYSHSATDDFASMALHGGGFSSEWS